MSIEAGLQASVERTVGEGSTAAALGSGDVEVWGTPSVVALCEAAAIEALAGHLDPDDTTVGTHIELDHLAPTLPGRQVTASATLKEVDGRMLHFSVEASDESGVVARGSHTRVRVDRQRFLEGAAKR